MLFLYEINGTTLKMIIHNLLSSGLFIQRNAEEHLRQIYDDPKCYKHLAIPPYIPSLHPSKKHSEGSL